MSRFAKHNLHLLSDMKNQVLLTESPLQYSKPNLEHKPSTNSSFSCSMLLITSLIFDLLPMCNYKNRNNNNCQRHPSSQYHRLTFSLILSHVLFFILVNCSFLAYTASFSQYSKPYYLSHISLTNCSFACSIAHSFFLTSFFSVCL